MTDDDIIGSVDEGVVLPPPLTAFTGAPLTWTEIAALAQALPPDVRDLPAVLHVPERVPKTTAYVIVSLTPRGVAMTDVLPI